MQFGLVAVSRIALLIGLVVLGAAPSNAIPVSLEVAIGGVTVDTLNEADLGCTDTSGVTASCNASTLTVGELQITSLNMNLDSDPSVNAVIAVQNLSLVTTLQFTLTVSLPVAPIPGGTLRGGSASGGVTENDGNTATLATPAGSAFYTALVDGVPAHFLYPDPTVLTVLLANESDVLVPGAFGTPIPSLPGGPVAASIGIRYDFTLTPQDSASFTSVFVVAVPEPNTALLFGLGVAMLARASRRP